MNEHRAISATAETAEPAAAGRSWRSWLWVALGIALAAVAAWWLVQRAGGSAAGNQRGRPPTTVGLATAKTADVPISIDALGTVTPLVTATVRPQVPGVLQRIAFTEGQLVAKGQLLAVIDPRPFEALVGQARGTLARDTALLADARLSLSRYQTLLKQDSIARQQVDTQAALVRQLQGTIATDEAAVRAAQLNVTYSRITAPVAGRVGLRQVDAGNYITPGDASGLVVVTQVQPIDVAFTLPEAQINLVRKRQATGARLPVTAFDRARTATIGQGVFSTLDNSVDVTTGTVKAKARFANGDNALFPNQFVNVRLIADVLAYAVTIPSSALRKGPKGDFVFVVTPDRTAHLRVVTLGPSMGQDNAVLAGLKPGEKVVTEGADRLTDGGKVMLAGDKRPAGGAQANGRRRRGSAA